MTDIPIIFSGPMVRALLDGRKTMTRRLAWGPRFQKAIDDEGGYPGWRWKCWSPGECSWPGKKSLVRMALPANTNMLIGHMAPSEWQKVKPGDRLWVRENLVPTTSGIDFAEGGDECLDLVAATTEQTAFWDRHALKRGDPINAPTVPSIHMPRWASRLTLVVTATKVERLQAISEPDAKAEGALYHDGRGIGHSGWRHDPDHGYVFSSAAGSFADLWVRLHGPESWMANPEVVALTFTVHKQNIDSLARAA